MKNLSKIGIALIIALSIIATGCKKKDSDAPAPTSTVDNSVQGKLNSGKSRKTPLEIYNSDNTLLEELYGKQYAGGLIFYFDFATGSGKVAATSDQASLVQWGCTNDNIGETFIDPSTGFSNFIWKSMGTAVGSGGLNTSDIVSQCTSTSAARVCSNLTVGSNSDWYLASRDELVALLTNVPAITGNYWSSSQTENGTGGSNVYAVYSNLTYLAIPKANTKNVRAIRDFLQ